MFSLLMMLQSSTEITSGATAALGSEPLPDIELHARITAKSLRVERQGRAEVTVSAEPVLVQHRAVVSSKPVPNAATVNDVVVKLDASVTLADPTSSPKGEPRP